MRDIKNIKGKQRELNSKVQKAFSEYFPNEKGNYEKYLNEIYWPQIFQKELEILCLRAENLHFGPDGTGNLLMTLGTTLEPLVLAVHLIKPESIFVLYKDSYHKEEFKTAISKIDSSGRTEYSKRIKPVRIPDQTGLGQAATVFKLLRGKGNTRAKLDDSEKKNIEELNNLIQSFENTLFFDITGAKKSISGGCMLFAAFYDIPVYYMDFTQYHPDLGRPYPGYCVYTLQSNPVAGFGLKEFQDLENSFNSRRFHEAERLFEKIIEKMDSTKEYFDSQEVDLYKEFQKFNNAYSDWQDGWWGDLAEPGILQNTPAHRFLKNLSAFPKRGSKGKYPQDYQAGLYDDLPGFLSYVTLELAVILRAEPLTPRNRFLRAFRLEEFLLGYLCYCLVQKNLLEYEVKNTSSNTITDQYLIKQAAARNYASLEHLFIRGSNHFFVNLGKNSVRFKKVKQSGINQIKQKVKDCLEMFHKNRWVRDAAVHGVGTGLEQHGQPDRYGQALVVIWQTLLQEKQKWFPNDVHSFADEINTLLKKENWFFDNRVAPVNWEAVQQAISSSLKP